MLQFDWFYFLIKTLTNFGLNFQKFKILNFSHEFFNCEPYFWCTKMSPKVPIDRFHSIYTSFTQCKDAQIEKLKVSLCSSRNGTQGTQILRSDSFLWRTFPPNGAKNYMPVDRFFHHWFHNESHQNVCCRGIEYSLGKKGFEGWCEIVDKCCSKCFSAPSTVTQHRIIDSVERCHEARSSVFK